MTQLGIFGKHPGFADFVEAGFSESVTTKLSTWLDTSLTEIRKMCGSDWNDFWDSAQALRFQIGRGVLGVGVAGILQPSRDSIGRRFPLIIGSERVRISNPAVDHDQSYWETLELHLRDVKYGNGAASLLSGLELSPESEAAEVPPNWAYRPDGDLAKLLTSTIDTDWRDAMVLRSYWWSPGTPGRAAVWLGCHGLPDVEALGMLLNGVAQKHSQDDEVG